MKPSIGRIVLFNADGKDRPAIITHVWSDECVDLHVFGELYGLSPIVSSAWRAQSSSAIGWRWPERV